MIQTFNTHLTSKKQLADDVYLLHFTLLDPPEIEFTPGQYLVMFVPHNGDHARRLYSIASPLTQKDSFELLVKIVPNGTASNFFLNLNEKDSVMFQGPAGRFTLNGSNKNKVFLATGTGLAPVRSMLLTELPRNADKSVTYHLLWGVPTFDEVFLIDEFKNLAQVYPNFSFTICVSRETSLETIPEDDRKFFKLGRITQDFAVELNNTDYYLCGNREVVESLKKHLCDERVDNTCVIFEKF